ncbi:hypothetical protein KI387_036316, partial [Taxus chinensis]
DERYLIWFSGKEEKQMRLSAVTKIIAGQRTSNFQRQPWPEKEYQSFSLIYGNGEQSLDLICKDKEQAEIWFVGLKTLTSGTQSLKQYVDSRSEGGLQSGPSTPAGHTRKKQPFSFLEDIEKLSQPGSKNVRPLKVQSLYGSPPRQFTEKCSSARLLYSAESQKSSERHSLVNSLHSFPLDLRSDCSKVQMKESSSEAFIVSLSNAISLSSQGSVLEDSDVLGDVLMWGEGIEDGILGGGVHKSGSSVYTQVDALLPRAVQSTVMLDVQRVACGVRHAALVTRKGEIFCWGEENGGRLGHRVDVDVSQPKLVEVFANNNIELVACGKYHTCATTVFGELYSWGDGSHGTGLLGHGSDRSQWLPRRVSGPLEGIRVTKVSCGEWHTAVVASSGVLFTFGDGTFGALGHGDTSSVLLPKKVESLKGLKTITAACGPWHTVAVVEVLAGNFSCNSSSRKLFTWGDGDKGRLGHGDNERKLVPTCVAALVNCSFVQVACGQTLTVALTVSGQVYTMGSQAHGQLGKPQADGKATVLVEGKLRGEFVEEISSGSYHVAVLTSKREIYTWGKGANGRLGHGDVVDRSTPTLVEAIKDRQVKSVSCGSTFTAVICLHKSITGADQSSCSGCKLPFGFTRKRHNCYNCGFVFCHACSIKKSTRACLAPNPSKPYRVCDPCFVQLRKAAESGFTLNGSRSRRLSLPHKTMVARDKSEKVETKSLKSPFFSPKVIITEKIEGFDVDSSSIQRKQQVPSNLNSIYERWGQVSCPARFHSNVRVHPSPAPNLQSHNASVAVSPVSREQSPPRLKSVVPSTSTIYTPSSVVDELKWSNRTLTEEILRLQERTLDFGLTDLLITRSSSRTQVKDIKQKYESKDAKLRHYESEIQEARALAREETARCKAAKEVIRVLTGQLKDMAEKLPMKTQKSNVRTFFSPLHNVLNEFLSPTNRGLMEVSELEDIKFYDHKFYLSPSTRVLKDVKVNGSCSPPLTHDTPTSAPGRSFGYQNSARSMDGPRLTGTKLKENSGKICKAENEHLPYTEWVEQDEPGVYITFISLADGKKDLKRVRFSALEKLMYGIGNVVSCLNDYRFTSSLVYNKKRCTEWLRGKGCT